MVNQEQKPGHTASPKRAIDLLAQYTEKNHAIHREVDAEELKMNKLFARRTEHLPGNNWCQDWVMWQKNNHPLLALCCRHEFNPVGTGPRLVNLVFSVSFGMVATNLIYLFYRTHPNANGVVFKADLDGVTYQVTYETILLITIGGLLHSLADLGMWHLTACACCFKSCISKLGPYVAIAISASLCAFSTLAIMWRAVYDNEGGENDVYKLDSFQFLMTYWIELISVYLFYYPMMSTLFFSGAVWGIFPCIGGRPKELKRQKDEAARMQLEATRNESFDDFA